MRQAVAAFPMLLSALACGTDTFQLAPPLTDGGEDGGFDAATVVNGCTAADFGAHDATEPASPQLIVFGVAKDEYNPPCLKVRVGQAVTWRGSFSIHPLLPDTAKSFIEPTTQDTAIGERTFTPNERGVFGYHCGNHGALGMTGAILVVP